MVHSIEKDSVILADSIRFLAVSERINEKFLRIMDGGGKGDESITGNTKISWSPVCCAFLGHSGPLV